LARERIIVKEAINALKCLLNEVIKKVSCESGDPPEKIALSSNLLSFAIRFLHEIPKIRDIILELTYRLEKLGHVLIDNASNILVTDNVTVINYDHETVYCLQIYPIARMLEALGGVYNSLPQYRNNEERDLIDDILNLFMKIFSSELVHDIFDSNQKLVPIVQGLLSVSKRLYDKNRIIMVDKILNKVLELALEEDPLLSKIYTQDIYYLIKMQKNDMLSDEEIKPLYANTNSNIFKKVLKGIEYLAIFGFDPPQSSINFVLSKMPIFFNEVFRIGDPEKTFIYFSSIAESIHNILRFYNNKAFAQATMNHLIEDTGWIARNNYNPIDFIKTVVGTSLLIHARGAIRR